MHSRETNFDMKHARILMYASIALMTSIIVQAQVWGSTALGVTALELRQVVGGELIVTPRSASGTDRGNAAAKRSDQAQRRREAACQIILPGCCH